MAILLTVLVIFFFVRQRRQLAANGFDFQPMTHSELEEKDLENYLSTQSGSYPSLKSGVITATETSGNTEESNGGNVKEDFHEVEHNTSQTSGTDKGSLL